MDNEKDLQTESTSDLTLDGSSLSLDVDVPTVPSLTAEEIKQVEDISTAVTSKDALPERNLEENLTPQELKAVGDFSQKIDINNSAQIMQYGAASQQKMSTFSEATLTAVKGKDLGDVGGMINSLVVELKDFDPTKEEKGGFLGLFKKPKSLEKTQAQFSSVETNVDKIVAQLEKHKVTLLTDITMLDKMYDMNLAYFKELTLYIIAGKKKLKEVEENDLVAIRKKAEESGLPEDAQKANDFANQCTRFDKKLHDLELTRNISIQMGPQIRMVQTNDSMMVEKIQSSIMNTIPLWKNQMVLSLGLAHSKNAIEAQRAVTNVTNELLKKNADVLKTSTIEAAKESERGIIDIETLRHTNQSLISTLDEVLQIQQDGRVKRRQAEGELQLIENQLKAKLLEINTSTSGHNAPTPIDITATTPDAPMLELPTIDNN